METKKATQAPTAVVRFYQIRKIDGDYHYGYNTYAEIQNVTEVNGEFIEGAARPLSAKAMRNIIDLTFSKEQRNYFSSKIIPYNLISFVEEKHSRKIVWWVPAKKIKTVFSKKLNMPGNELFMPALLFCVNIDQLRIFALTKSERPVMSTQLHNAPLLNYFGSNAMCWGSVKHDSSKILEIDKEMEFWEKVLWGSEFSHAAGVKTTKTDIVKLYRELITSGKKFPVSELTKTKQRLSDIL